VLFGVNTLSKVRGCRYRKLIDFVYIIIDRFRYHENKIINKGFLLLVGIVDCFAARACSPHCRNNVIFNIEASRVYTHAHPYLAFPDFDSNVLCSSHSGHIGLLSLAETGFPNERVW